MRRSSTQCQHNQNLASAFTYHDGVRSANNIYIQSGNFLKFPDQKENRNSLVSLNENIQPCFERALQHAVFGQQVVLELLLTGEGSRG